MTSKKKIPIALAIVVVIIICGVIFAIADNTYQIDWQKEYSKEEWAALDDDTRQYILERRSCEHSPDNPNLKYPGFVKPAGVDCKKYF